MENLPSIFGKHAFQSKFLPTITVRTRWEHIPIPIYAAFTVSTNNAAQRPHIEGHHGIRESNLVKEVY